MKVGVIGLGKMGAGMARNVAKTYPVVAFDTNPQAAQAVAGDNVTFADSANDVAAQVQVLITMLPGPDEIEQVVGGENGAAAQLGDGALWVDMSSSSLETMERIRNAAPDRGWSSIDAPVTGGVPGAESGTLQVFVGGTDADYQQALPVLEQMGNPERILHVGELGAGYAVKLCINLGFFLHALAGAEVMALGVKSGVDLELLHNALTGSNATSSFLEHDLAENVFAGDYKEYFRLALALKDIRLAVDLGRRVGVPMELSALVEQLQRRAYLTYGDGGQLLAVKQLEETTGVSFRLDQGE